MREIKFRAWNKEFKFMSSNEHTLLCLLTLLSDKTVVVMQYTGLKDKKGKEIYEKDLVICYTKDGEKVYTHPQVVEIPEWHKLIWDETNTEVVGNIYENPKLIKQ